MMQMKRVRVLILILSFVGASNAQTQGQAPQRTTVGHKYLGEPISEVYTPEMDTQMTSKCPQLAEQHKQFGGFSGKSFDPSVEMIVRELKICQEYLEVKASGEGTLHVSLPKLEANEHPKLYDAWMNFHGGRINYIYMFWTQYSPFSEQVQLLTEKYGPPTKNEIVTKQNGFGATWQLGQATWSLANGDSILAEETMDHDGHETHVVFTWSGAPKEPATKSPY
jgi:hypothetical protein